MEESGGIMFIGEYNHSIDNKGRVIMPSKFREELGEKFYVTKGMEGCVFVYDENEWYRLEEKTKQLRLTSKKARQFERIFYAPAREMEFDKQGRFVIPQNLREYADISKEATIIGAASYSGFMTIFDALIDIKEPILGDNLANLILGAVLVGLGLAIVFRQNASTGGTDVLAKILESKIGVSVSKGMLIVDAFVIAMAGLTFGLQSGIYAFMSLYITTWVLDNTIAGFNSKIQMVIVSKEIENINNFIHKEINRGTTFYEARGGYTKKEQNVLVSIVDTKQYIKIRNYIDSIDDDAFVYITNINEVIGYGFSREAANNVQIRENAKANN